MQDSSNQSGQSNWRRNQEKRWGWIYVLPWLGRGGLGPPSWPWCPVCIGIVGYGGGKIWSECCVRSQRGVTIDQIWPTRLVLSAVSQHSVATLIWWPCLVKVNRVKISMVGLVGRNAWFVKNWLSSVMTKTVWSPEICNFSSFLVVAWNEIEVRVLREWKWCVHLINRITSKAAGQFPIWAKPRVILTT